MATLENRLPLLPAWASRAIQHWIEKRHKKHLDRFTSGRGNIYILPSKSGIFYDVVILFILIGAINYNNSLAYLLCFFLASLGFICMLQTHQNLQSIQLTFHHAVPVFSGQNIHYEVIAKNCDRKIHAAVHLQSALNLETFMLAEGDSMQNLEIIEQATISRGYQRMEQFKLYSEYPLGLFHAWCMVKLDASALVYPRPLAKPVELNMMQQAQEKGSVKRPGQEDFAGIREAVKTDSPRQIAWKKVAQTGSLYAKQFEAEYGESRIYDIDELDSHYSLEEKLSLLCQVVLDAEKSGVHYGLKLGSQQLPVASGSEHRHSCLKALALYSGVDRQ